MVFRKLLSNFALHSLSAFFVLVLSTSNATAQEGLQVQIDSLTSIFNQEMTLAERAKASGDSSQPVSQNRLIQVTAELAKSYWVKSYYHTTPDAKRQNLEKGIDVISKTQKIYNSERLRGFHALLEIERLPFLSFEEKFQQLIFLKSELQNLVFQFPHQNEANIAYALLFKEISSLTFFERTLSKYWYKVQLPEPVTPDIEIIFLLQAKVDGAYPVFVHYKLAETYIRLYNFLGIEESLNAVLSSPSEYAYLDDYYKKLAFSLKEQYKNRENR
jgi:hypothetical protein